MANKDLKIETLRGVACLLLVAYHTIGDTPASGLRIDHKSLWGMFAEICVYICLPLFALLSGYIYSLKPARKDKLPAFYNNKLLRLGLPMIAASTLFFLTSNLVGTKYALNFDEIYKIYIFPYAHYWYLQASLIIFLVIAVLEKFSLIDTRRQTLALLLVSILLYAFARNFFPNIFSINSAVYLLPFFAAGMCMERFSLAQLEKIKYPVALIALSCVAHFILNYLNIVPHSPFSLSRNGDFGLVLSLCVCVALFLMRFQSKGLAVIGLYSYTIYLYHIFATSGSRIILDKTVPGLPLMAIFIVGFLAGTIFPIILHFILVRNKYTSSIFLGAKMRHPGISELKTPSA